jgi:cob(I)alamin adenosyltransferase
VNPAVVQQGFFVYHQKLSSRTDIRQLELRMDKKAKKRLEVLRKRLQKCQQQLAGARQQIDDPDEIQKIETEISEIQAEIEKLKNS